MTEKTLNIVLIEHESLWSAQCLQYDIGAQGSSLNDVMYEIQRSVMGHIAICQELEVEPFSELPAAPRKYWKLWEDSKTAVSVDRTPFRSPVPYMPIAEVRAA